MGIISYRLCHENITKLSCAKLSKNGLNKQMKIGIGYDIHKFTKNRKLILGGVEIPFEKGLLGHSDADVLTHAICDALLGAIGLGDIGEHFPDSDIRFKDANSLDLLREVDRFLTEKNYKIENIDTIVFAEEPKLINYKKAMRGKLAETLKIDANNINIKATTMERLGTIGKKEGIAAQAVALIKKKL